MRNAVFLYLARIVLMGALIGIGTAVVTIGLDDVFRMVFSQSLADTEQEAISPTLRYLALEATLIERVGLVLLMAALEEVFFRKIGFAILRSRGSSTAVCVLVTSILFGLMHAPHSPFAAILSGLVGVVLGTMYAYRGDRLDLPVVAHCVHNLTVFATLDVLLRSATPDSLPNLAYWVYPAGCLSLALGLRLIFLERKASGHADDGRVPSGQTARDGSVG